MLTLAKHFLRLSNSLSLSLLANRKGSLKISLPPSTLAVSLGPLTLLKHLRHLPLRQRQQQQQRVHINIFRTACNFLNFLLNSRRFCLPPPPHPHLPPSLPFLWACNNQLRLRHSGILCAPTFMVIVWQQRKINLFFLLLCFLCLLCRVEGGVAQSC